MTTPSARRMDTAGWHRRALGAAFALAVSSNLPMFLTGALADELGTDLGTGAASIGAAISLPYLVGALASRPVSHAVDRLGWRSSVRLNALATILALLVIGGATSPWVLHVTLALVGLSLSMAVTTTSVIITFGAPDHRRGLVFGGKQSAIPVSTAFVGLLIPLVAVTWSWRGAFVVAAVLPLIALGLTFAPRGSEPRRPVRRARARRQPNAGLRPDGPLVALAIAAAAGTLTASALSTFLVPTLTASGVSISTAGVTLTVASIASLVVRLGGGLVADRHPGRAVPAAAGLLLLGAAAYFLIASGRPTMMQSGAVLAHGAGWGWTGLLFYTVAMRYKERVAAATGVLQAGLMAGMAGGPLAFGSLSTWLGLPRAWQAIGVCAALSGLLFAGTAVVRPQTAATTPRRPEARAVGPSGEPPAGAS